MRRQPAVSPENGIDEETMVFARTAAHLLHEFMRDCNVIGAREAGVILARGIKGYLSESQCIVRHRRRRHGANS